MFYKNKMTVEEVRQASKEQAERDLQAGVIGYRTFGLIRSPHLLEQAYKERGVRLRIVAGDCITSYDTANAGGYNSVMGPEIERLHGPDFHKEVRARWQELRQNLMIEKVREDHGPVV